MHISIHKITPVLLNKKFENRKMAIFGSNENTALMFFCVVIEIGSVLAEESHWSDCSGGYGAEERSKPIIVFKLDWVARFQQQFSALWAIFQNYVPSSLAIPTSLNPPHGIVKSCSPFIVSFEHIYLFGE